MPTQDDERRPGGRPSGASRGDADRERDRVRRRRDQDEYDDREAPSLPRSPRDQDEYDDRGEREPGRRSTAALARGLHHPPFLVVRPRGARCP